MKLSSATPERRGVIDNGLVTDATLKTNKAVTLGRQEDRAGREDSRQGWAELGTRRRRQTRCIVREGGPVGRRFVRDGDAT